MFDCVAFAFTPLSTLVIALFFLHKLRTSQSFLSAGALILDALPASWRAGASSSYSSLSSLL